MNWSNLKSPKKNIENEERVNTNAKENDTKI